MPVLPVLPELAVQMVAVTTLVPAPQVLLATLTTSSAPVEVSVDASVFGMGVALFHNNC